MDAFALFRSPKQVIRQGGNKSNACKRKQKNYILYKAIRSHTKHMYVKQWQTATPKITKASFVGLWGSPKNRHSTEEDFELEEEVDLAFTSPPYFNTDTLRGGNWTGWFCVKRGRLFVLELWWLFVKNRWVVTRAAATLPKRFCFHIWKLSPYHWYQERYSTERTQSHVRFPDIEATRWDFSCGLENSCVFCFFSFGFFGAFLDILGCFFFSLGGGTQYHFTSLGRGKDLGFGPWAGLAQGLSAAHDLQDGQGFETRRQTSKGLRRPM